jgi:hypothetical protein
MSSTSRQLQPYLSTYTQIALNSGWLQTAMDVEGNAEGVFTAKGEVTVNKLAAIDVALKQDLLKWDRLTASGIEYASQPERLRIAKIDARAPVRPAHDRTRPVTQHLEAVHSRRREPRRPRCRPCATPRANERLRVATPAACA